MRSQTFEEALLEFANYFGMNMMNPPKKLVLDKHAFLRILYYFDEFMVDKETVEQRDVRHEFLLSHREHLSINTPFGLIQIHWED